MTSALRRMLLCLAAAGLALRVAGQTPIEATPYGRALFRFEGRAASPVLDAAKRQAAEAALRRAGMDGRWIQMVDHHGSPLLETPYLPGPGAAVGAVNEAALRAWVAEIHAQGSAALSWYPLTFCEAAFDTHPDWRQQFIEPYPIPGEERIFCCINTGYGDALIQYCVDAVRRLNLDGIWFDGSVWTGIWQRPWPLSCRCEACRISFRRDSGLEIPTRLNWDDPVFRKWVAWRFRVFGQFIGRLARSIRAAKPGAAVIINHYHRPGIPWRSAIPIDRYEADIISGSEAAGDDGVDLTMRLCRAYGRSQAEVWRPLDTPGAPEANAEPLLHHALACFVAGGLPSFGGDAFSPLTAPTAALLAPAIRRIAPLAGGRSLTPVALHVSQQTETFYYARGDAPASASAPYWNSLSAWTAALGRAGIPPEYLFDADFTAAGLARHRAVLMPLSISLSPAQARAALEYARRGGVLLLGVAAGQADAEGQRRPGNPLAAALGFRIAGAPRPDGGGGIPMTLRPLAGGAAFPHEGVRCPVTLTSAAWKPAMASQMDSRETPCLAERAWGRGRVILLDTDGARTWGRELVSGGRTRLGYVRRTGGGWALQFTDDAIAPESYYPDMETRIPAFGTPDCTGGALEFDLRPGADGQAQIDLRSTNGPLEGPMVSLAPGGRILADGMAVATAPIDAWSHVRIAFDFTAGGRPAGYTLTVTLPDGSRPSLRRPTANPAWRAADWFVVYGPGAKPGVFAIDNVTLSRRTLRGADEVVVRYDFEEGPSGLDRPTLADVVARFVAARVPLDLRVQTTPQVRFGIFAAGPRTVRVHLYHRAGLRAGLASPTGPIAAITTGFRVRSARARIAGRSLAVTPAGAGSRIRVPAGLYEVVDLER